MSKSIMQDYEKHQCYLCMMLYGDEFPKLCTEEHHVFGGPNRSISEHYGIKVRLCLKHHTVGPEAVHTNAGNMDLLHKAGEKAFIRKYGYKEYMQQIRKNYLSEKEIKNCMDGRSNGNK